MKHGIRVMHVLEATLGGTLRYLENIADAMEQSSIISALAYGSSRADSRLEPLLAKMSTSGWSTYHVGMVRPLQLQKDLSAFLELRTAIRDFQPDIVHCHSSKAGGLGRLASMLSGLPVITLYSPHALAAPLGMRYLRLERLLARQTDGYIAVSDSERDEICDFGLANPSRVHVVSPSIDPMAFAPRSREQARRRLGWDDAPCVLAIGRLMRQKNPLGFLEVVQELHRRDPRTRAIWLGAGEMEQGFLIRTADLGLQDVVRLVPWQRDVRDYIAASNLLLSTSAFESFGYMVAEALSMGVPAVASKVSGTRDIMQGSLGNWLYAPGDWQGAAGLAAQLLQDETTSALVGQLGAEAVGRRFSPQQMRSSIYEVYLDLLQRKYPSRNYGTIGEFRGGKPSDRGESNPEQTVAA